MRFYDPMFRLLLTLALLGPLPAPQGLLPDDIFGVEPAFADDDDDDGGDDDDDDDRVIRRATPRRAPPQRAQIRRATPVPPPDRVPDEIVASGLDAQQIGRLTGEGFAVIDSVSLAALGSELVKLRIPAGMSLDAARDRVRTEAPASAIDFNHFFRPGQDGVDCDEPHCVAPSLVGWPIGSGRATGCGAQPITLGLIDTAVNPAHEAFRDGQVEVIRLSNSELPESGRQHGTAVAALLVGSAGSATPGLLPAAKLITVDAFHQGPRDDDRADAFDLIRALDLLAARDVGVVNMSLSGPPNDLLEALVAQLSRRSIILVAAAGNGGPKAKPAYPAAYEAVIAVTAIDRRKRIYRRAGQGGHVDLAAPGVEVWAAASIKGARPKTGTSFAAPFVTAAIAMMRSSGEELTSFEIGDRLAKSAEDLGDPGKDSVFGWGLLNARDLCRGEITGTSP